jgi:hypothetical protein
LADTGLPIEERPSDLSGESIGVFAGATRIQVRSTEGDPGNRGRIDMIDLHYPPDVEFEQLVERFAAVHGPPTSRWESEHTVTAAWSGRDSQVSLSKSRLVAGGYEVRLILSDPRM